MQIYNGGITDTCITKCSINNENSDKFCFAQKLQNDLAILCTILVCSISVVVAYEHRLGYTL